jgi:hypothetical protein
MTNIKTAITRALVGAVILAQPLDVWTTNRALAMDIGVVEANPVMAFAMEHLGSAWWVPKLLIALFALVVVAYMQRIRTRTIALAGSIAAAYTVVVLNNYFTWL